MALFETLDDVVMGIYSASASYTTAVVIPGTRYVPTCVTTAVVGDQKHSTTPACRAFSLSRCWIRHPELYQMRGSPFTKKDGKVRDRAGTVIDLFPGVREALLDVHKDDRFRGCLLYTSDAADE